MADDRFLGMKKLIAIMILLTQLMSCQPAMAQTIDVERLATAIRKAEGNPNYGILKNIKGNNFRKACIQTIRKRILSWDGRRDFIEYLGISYAPIGAKNDPNNLNKNWTKNVRYWYARTNPF